MQDHQVLHFLGNFPAGTVEKRGKVLFLSEHIYHSKMFAFRRYGQRVAAAAAVGSASLWQGYQLTSFTKCEVKQEPAIKIETEKKQVEEKFYHGSEYPEKAIRKPNLPYPLWDPNWDGLEVENATSKEKREIRKKGVTKHIILVRHGQYVEDKDPEKRVLTPLGREQAELTGKRLAEMMHGVNEEFGECNIKVIRVSNMIRAIETADIILKHLPEVSRTDPDPDLNEGRYDIVYLVLTRYFHSFF